MADGNSLSTIDVLDSESEAKDSRMGCLKRLDTFSSWPSDTPIGVLPSDLAAAGFEYTKRGSTVRCKHCGIEISSFTEGAIPIKIHREKSPGCRFLLENDVPISTGECCGQTVHGNTDRMNKLKEENMKLRNDITCKKCNREQVQTLFLPCRHLIVCEHCAEALDKCSLCDTKILGTVRVIMIPKFP